MMGREKLIDLAGQQFGDWKVLEHIGMYRGKAGAMWLCRCVCGKERKVHSLTLRNGASKGCGCQRRGINKRTHGYAPKHKKRPPEYVSWAKIIMRCYNPNCPEYKWYGAKGIRMYRPWRKNFAAFLAYVGPRPGPGYVMGRINHSKNYQPSNCGWIPRSENSIERNKGYRPTVILPP